MVARNLFMLSIQIRPHGLCLCICRPGLRVTLLGADPSTAPAPAPEQRTPEERGIPSAGGQLAAQQSTGSISGTVVDESGAVVAGARVRLTREGQSPIQETLSGNGGQFSFANLAPGPFQITIISAGFATQTSSGILHSGENYVVPKYALAVATAFTDVEVGLTQTEVATEEIKIEEKQRVLGVIPNFYVTYDPHAVPLNSKQKFGLAWKTTVDPVSFVLTGGVAGVEQALNDFSGYGQGAQGYAKRYGAGYADLVTGTFIGSRHPAVASEARPALFLQGNRQQAIADLVCDCQCGDLQGRQRTLAAELLEYPRKPRCRRYLKSVLSGSRSRGSGINLRNRAHRDWSNRRRQYLARICRPEVHPEVA